MLTFYEMLQLVENDDWRDTRKDAENAAARANASGEFAADQMGYDTGDYGDEYVGPVTPKGPVRKIRGTADKMINQRYKNKKPGKLFRPGDIQDVGSHLDPKVGKGHWVGKPTSREDGNLRASDMDITGDGTQDVYDVDDLDSRGRSKSRMDKTKQVSEPKAGYSKAATDRAIADANKVIKFWKRLPPDYDHFEKETLEAIDDLKTISGKPGIDPETVAGLQKLADKLKKKIGSTTRGVPAQDSPHRSPMAKYMLRKHSNVF